MTDPSAIVPQFYMFAPRTLAMYALGGAWAIGFFENKARDSLHSSEAKLKSFADSYNINKKIFPFLAAISAGLGILAWKKS